MRNERGEKKVFYYKKNKKYAEIMPHTKNKVIEKYTILKTDQVDLGWETIATIPVVEVNKVRMIDEKMIRILRELVHEGYEILGKKEVKKY